MAMSKGECWRSSAHRHLGDMLLEYELTYGVKVAAAAPTLSTIKVLIATWAM